MTSIEWLMNELKKERIIRDDLKTTIALLTNEAKEMHKAEIEDAFQDGKWDWNEHITNGTESKDLEQYYKETFKKDKL
jgi:hypothetical protein